MTRHVAAKSVCAVSATSLRATANRVFFALRGSECNRGTGCGKIARSGLYGRRRVTGVPTVAANSGFDRGVGTPGCLCAGPKYLSTGGKELRGVKFLSRGADTVTAAQTRILSQGGAEL
jgi:hypothetical protein